jgi:hypothetical protein
MKTIRRSTLLDLIQTVQDLARSDEEVVAIIAHMIATGRVALSGTFANPRPATAVVA